MCMRVLHLINQASPQASAVTLNLMATAMQKVEAQHQAILIGGQPLCDAARASVIESFIPMGAPGGHALAALPRLRHWLRNNAQPDMVHCWSVGSLLLATLACRSAPRLLTLTLMPSLHELHLLRMLAAEAGPAKLGIVPITATIAREVLCCGVDPQCVDILRPGVDMGLIQASERDAIRTRWELAGDDPLVVMLLSDPPTQCDAARATLMLGLTQVGMQNTQRPVHLLIHPDQKNRLAALNPMRPLNNEHLILSDAAAAIPWQVLPACDAVIALDDGGAGLSIPWAMAANVPIVGHATAGICEWVEDHHSALLVAPGQPAMRHIAGKLTDILSDPQLTYKLRDTARHEAFSFYSRTRFGSDLNTVYHQLLDGKELNVPDMPSTGGLRFAGRG
ncbi:MAG TPA: hypothetical protein DCM28_12235 [Phycisphaerales bacterium]|nr:hypothetical protein [Phycisphaerales bacterium]|tara:strand:+ start:44492 stop:45670 length:1179 start_codon:yes stop_codon:yes gene_type:complete